MFRSPLLCAFDASGRYFVSVTADNRLKLWDIATGNLLQHFQEDRHLTANYTAIAYSLAAPTAQQKKKPPASSAASAQSTPPLGHVALGSKSGAISIFNLTTGDISHVSSNTGQAHTSSVLSLAFHHNATRLLSTGADEELHTYAFPSLTLLTSTKCPASVQLLQPLPLSADELLAAMGSALAVVDVSGSGSASGGEGTAVNAKKRYAPLADSIVGVDVTGDGKLFATASSDRHVQLWDGTAMHNKKNKPIRAQHTITLSAAATGVVFNQSTTGPYHLAVVVERRTVQIFTYPQPATSPSSPASTSADNGSTHTPTTSTPLTTIHLPTTTPASTLAAQRKQVSLTASLNQAQHNDRHNQQSDNRKKKHNKRTALHASTLVDEGGEGGGEMVVGVRFVSGEEVVVVRGDRERVVFERVKYGGSGAGGEEVVLEARMDESVEAQSEEGLPRKKRSHDVTVLQTSSAPLTTTALASQAAPRTKKPKLSSPAITPLSPPTTSLTTSTTSFSSTLPLIQRTLAERLAELEKRAGTYAGDVRVKAASGGGEVVVPKAGSLQTLLTQALHTNDDALFEYCLSASMSSAAAGGNAAAALSQSSSPSIPATLKQTIQRVPAAYLLPLLTRLTSLLHSRPSRALPVLTWLHCLLLTHPSYFLSLPPASLHSAFARLIGLVDARVASYKKMCRLQGKLDVIIAQLDAAVGGVAGEDEEAAVSGPRMRYIEGQGMVRGEEAGEGGEVAGEGEGEDEEKEDRRQQPASGKKRRRRRGHATVSPVVQPQSADMDEDEMDDEGTEDGGHKTKQRGRSGFVLNGLNGADLDELDMDEVDDD